LYCGKTITCGKRIYPLDSYIAGITKKLVKEKIRKIRKTEDIEDFENVISMYDGETFIDERQEILDLQKGLKEIDIKIFNMFYYESKLIKDIAKTLEITESNVKTKLHRIRKKVRKMAKGELR